MEESYSINKIKEREGKIQIRVDRKSGSKEWGHLVSNEVPKGVEDGPLIRRRKLEGDTSRFRSFQFSKARSWITIGLLVRRGG